jgi:DHA3 family macrolide efflux protein-like MFS transporter
VLNTEKSLTPHKSIWSNLVFIKVWITYGLSILGDALTFLIIPIWILDITDSPAQASLATAVTVAAIALLSPFSGTLADRFSRRYIMIFSDAARLLIMLVLAYYAYKFFFILPIVLFLIALRAIGSSFFNPASSAALTTIVDEHHLKDAVSIQLTTRNVMSVVGPLIGGVLIGLIGYHGIFIIDSITFLISVIILSTVVFKRDINVGNNSVGRKKFHEDLKDGLSIFKSSSRLLAIVISAAVINFLGAAYLIAIQVTALMEFNLSGVFIGLLFSVFPAGMAIGAIIMKKIEINKEGKFIIISLIFISLSNIFMGLVHNIFLFMFLYFIAGLWLGMSNVIFGVLYRKLVPKEMQGRFFGTLGSILTIISPIGYVFSGMLLEIITGQSLMVILGLLLLLFSIILLFVPGIREVDLSLREGEVV